jgi:hypothetical protein
MSTTPDRQLVRELWTTSIETQLRLATFASRSRQIALAVVTIGLVIAAIALSGSAPPRSFAIAGAHLVVHPGVIVLGIAALAFAGFAIIDRQTDHLLRGAMKFTEELEEKLVKPAAGGELAVGLAQSFAREKPDERQQKMFRTSSVAVPAVLGLMILVATNMGVRRASAVEAVAAPAPAPVADETAQAVVADPAQAPVPSPSIMPGTTTATTTGKTVARPGKTPAVAGKPAEGAPGASTAAAGAAAPAVSAEAAPAKPAEAAPTKPAEAAAPPPKPVEEAAPQPKPAEPPPPAPAKPAEPAAPATP